MHTNPVLITFLSLLYYKNLDEHVRRFQIEKKIFKEQEDDKNMLKMRTFIGRLSISGPPDPIQMLHNKYIHKSYNIRVLIRWHLLLLLSKNKQLIYFRKHQFNKKLVEPKEKKPELVDKVKSIVTCKPCKKNNKQKSSTKSKTKLSKVIIENKKTQKTKNKEIVENNIVIANNHQNYYNNTKRAKNSINNQNYFTNVFVANTDEYQSQIIYF